ncbi:MAG: ABC transporter permease subunit [Methanoculleaceae archaeon]
MDQVISFTEILFPALWEGLIAASAPFGLLTGIVVAIGRQNGGRIISTICEAFVYFIRGRPLLLLLFILHFGLPSIGIKLPAFVAPVIGFILCNGAYNSEYIRGAILSVRDGQIIAAEALGMSRFQAVRHIVIPQALRRAIPGLTSEFIYLIK